MNLLSGVKSIGQVAISRRYCACVCATATLSLMVLASCGEDKSTQPQPEPLVPALSRSTWAAASAPIGVSGSDRSPFGWYNRFEPYSRAEIFPAVAAAAESIPVLTLVLANDRADDKGWGGIVRSIPTSSTDWSTIGSVDFRIQGHQGLVRIAFGRVTEDMNANGLLDSEDKVREGVRDGILDADEDTGLDGLFSTDEPGYDPIMNPDPSGDDWYYSEATKDDYSHINGTEGNRADPIHGLFPDSEDLNGNHYLDESNDYFEFDIDLADMAHPFLVPNSEYCLNCSDFAELGPWRTWRLPITDSAAATRVIGFPSWQSVRSLRVVVSGVDSGLTCRINIADMSMEY